MNEKHEATRPQPAPGSWYALYKINETKLNEFELDKRLKEVNDKLDQMEAEPK